jgi:hypothetical protein
MMVLLIDGPERGNVIEMKRSHIVLPTFAGGNDTVDTTTYHAHQFRLLNRVLHVASIHLLTEGIDPDNLFDLIASDKAKMAASLR